MIRNLHSFLRKDLIGTSEHDTTETDIDWNFRQINRIRKYLNSYTLPYSANCRLNDLITRISLLNDRAYYDESVHPVNAEYVTWALRHGYGRKPSKFETFMNRVTHDFINDMTK